MQTFRGTGWDFEQIILLLYCQEHKGKKHWKILAAENEIAEIEIS